jgi:Cd2+/Zn2+-exporting ATPase
VHVRTEAPVSASFQACANTRYTEPEVASPGTPPCQALVQIGAHQGGSKSTAAHYTPRRYSGRTQARVAVAVEDAKNTLSETEALVGRFATWYTPIVLGLAVVLGCYKGVQQFLVVLVAGCPCALLGAAPFVQGATLTLLAKRHRLLVKHATTLESLATIRAIGLDKTGTLTSGHFELLRLAPLPGAAHTRQALHRWVAAVEDQDNHPLARSLVASYKGCVADFVASGQSLPEVSGFQRHGRDGVSATVEGRRVGVGNAGFVRATLSKTQATQEEGDGDEDLDMPPRLRAARRRVREKERAAAAATDQPAPDAAVAAEAAFRLADEIAAELGGSGSVLFATVDGTVAGTMILDDALKPEAATTVQQLKTLGVRPMLLTGDCLSAAQRVARAGVCTPAMRLSSRVSPAPTERLARLHTMAQPPCGPPPATSAFEFTPVPLPVCAAPATVGISEADTHAGLLPEDKQRLILEATWQGAEAGPSPVAWQGAPRELEAGFLPKVGRGSLEVGFVGDGLNDCPALASAHVGIVLQEVGSQATVDAATAVLQADIEQLPAAIIIARRSRRLVLTNLFLALGINVTVIVLAATVGLPLWLSVLSDSGGLLVVLANSLWPLTWRVGTAAQPGARARSI